MVLLVEDRCAFTFNLVDAGCSHYIFGGLWFTSSVNKTLLKLVGSKTLEAGVESVTWLCNNRKNRRQRRT